MITVQNSVYSNNPHTIDELKMAITEYIRNVGRAILNTVFENTLRRFNKCLETGGGHLNVTCTFLYCNHQVHRDYLTTLYNGDGMFSVPCGPISQAQIEIGSGTDFI
jgi:precorrin-6B methylase 2